MKNKSYLSLSIFKLHYFLKIMASFVIIFSQKEVILKKLKK